MSLSRSRRPARAVARHRRLFFEPLEARRMLVNQPPQIVVPAPLAAVEDVSSVLSGIEVSDPDLGAGNLQVKVGVAVGQLSAAAVGGATVAGGGSNLLTLLGSLADVNATLAGLTYLSVANDSGAKAFSVEASDGAATTTAAETLFVSARNDAPVNTAPGPFSTGLNVPLEFGGASIFDLDAGGSDVQLTLTASGGVLSVLGDKTGLTVIVNASGDEIDGLNDPLVRLIGNQAAINAALQTVRFTPTAGFVGSASIEMGADDQGSSGGGGGQVDNDTIAIDVIGPPPNPNQVLSTGAGHDSVVLKRVGTKLVATSGAGTLLNVDFHLITSVTLNAQGGNDLLSVDLSGGNPIPSGGLFFHGGSQSAGGGDVLSVIGTGVEMATYRPDGTANPLLDNDGTIEIDGRTIAFTGLEPIDVIGMAVASIVLPGGDDVVNVTSGATFGGGQAAIRVGGTSGGVPFETVAFRGNGTIRVDTTASDASDAVTLVSADNAHGNANFVVSTGSGSDAIAVQGSLTFAGAVTLASQQINFGGASILTAGGVVTLDAGTGPITDGAIGPTNVAAPSLNIAAAAFVNLDTHVGSLAAATAGSVVLREQDDITLTAVAIASGSLSLVAGGNVDAQHVSLATDAADNAIQIVAGFGDIAVGNLIAGGGALADVLLFCGGSILDDGSDATRIVGDLVQLQGQDIGQPLAPARIETTANRLNLNSLSAAAAGTHGTFLDELDAVTLDFAMSNRGDIDLTAGGTIQATLVRILAGPRSLTLMATEGDIVGGSIRQTSLLPGGTVTLSAEDNLTLPAGSLLESQGGTVVLQSIDGPDAGGSTIAFAGDVDADSMSVVGSLAADTFSIRPDSDDGLASTPIGIFGLAPVVVPGDVLQLNVAGLGAPTFFPGPGPADGQYQFAAAAPVSYSSIEAVATPGGLQDRAIDLALLGFQDGSADEIFVRLDASGANLLIDVNGVSVFAGAAADVKSLAIVGSSDDENLRIDEVNGRLPRFAGQAQAAHLGASAALLLETLHTAGGPWDAGAVTIHFAGGAGINAIGLNLQTVRSVAYTSDTLSGTNSGNLVSAPLTGLPDFLLSFANLSPLALSGGGGELLVDASGTPTDALTIGDDATASDGWSQAAGSGGLETTRFRGFDSFTLVGGNGSQRIDLLGLDAATSLTLAMLHGGNTADLLDAPGTDAAGDAIRIHSSPPQTSIHIDVAGGDDLVQLFDGALTVDGIRGPVAIDGGNLGGNDRLEVVDRGSAAANAVLVDQNSIEGITGFSGAADITYTNIDVLDLTATQASDILAAAFAPGSDLESVTLSGWTGGDQFYLSTTDEQIGGPATGILSIHLFGDAMGNPNAGDGHDTFGESPADMAPGFVPPAGSRMIRPSASTTIQIDGGRPTAASNLPLGDAAGDILNLDVTHLGPAVLVATLGANPAAPGAARSLAVPPSHQQMNFIEIEDLNLVDRGILTAAQMGDLFVRGTNLADNIQFVATANPNVARVAINAFQGTFTIPGKTVVYGLGGNDYLLGGSFNHAHEFYGGEGDDYLTGYHRADKLVGGEGRDRINAGQGDNIVWGDSDPVEAGLPDTLANRQLLANALPGRFNNDDILSALDGHDTLYGGSGNDQLTTGGGNDEAFGGHGHDNLSLGAGSDRGYGGDGNDTLGGAQGSDLLSGGEGNDNLLGGEGIDVLIGGGGHDTLDGGEGNDLLLGGSLTYAGQASESQAAGDAQGAAMLALLADWSAANPGSLAIAPTVFDTGLDKLRGSGGSDKFSADSLAELLDFTALDSLL